MLKIASISSKPADIDSATRAMLDHQIEVTASIEALIKLGISNGIFTLDEFISTKNSCTSSISDYFRGKANEQTIENTSEVP